MNTTRDHILDAAAAVIHNLGLKGATTREIALAAGLSEAALYRHFSDKAELFLCVIGERLPQLIVFLRDLPNRAGERTVRANLEELARVALPFYDETLPIAASLFAEPELLSRHREVLREKKVGPQRSIEMVATYIRNEQRYGRINSKVDPEAVASLLIGACVGRSLMRTFVGEPTSSDADERFIKSTVRTLMLGLTPEDRG